MIVHVGLFEKIVVYYESMKRKLMRANAYFFYFLFLNSRKLLWYRGMSGKKSKAAGGAAVDPNTVREGIAVRVLYEDSGWLNAAGIFEQVSYIV
jgi:hypothetical protein